jgi:hypothetical protein
MSERVTVQGKAGRSATTNPLDEGIEQDQNTGSTAEPGRPQANIRNRLNPHPGRIGGVALIGCDVRADGHLDIRGMLAEMGRQVGAVLYVVAMAAVIVGVDLLFFRNRFWERLFVNIGIVLVFAAFYLRFLRRP